MVADRALLAADRERGIRVRDVRGGSVRASGPSGTSTGSPTWPRPAPRVERGGRRCPDASPRLRAALAAVAADLLRPSLVLSQAETERRRAVAAAAVAPVVIPIRRGEVVVPAGERIERRHLAVLRGMKEQTRLFDRAAMRVGAGVLVAATLIVLWAAAARLGGTHPAAPARRAPPLGPLPRHARAPRPAGWRRPTSSTTSSGPSAWRPSRCSCRSPAGAAIAAMLLSPAAGVLLAIAVGSSVGLLGGPSVVLGVQVTLASVAAALLLARVQRRRHVWRAGLAVGALQAVLVAAGWLFSGRARFEVPPARPRGRRSSPPSCPGRCCSRSRW